MSWAQSILIFYLLFMSICQKRTEYEYLSAYLSLCSSDCFKQLQNSELLRINLFHVVSTVFHYPLHTFLIEFYTAQYRDKETA